MFYLFDKARKLVQARFLTEYAQAKTGKYPRVIFPNFQKIKTSSLQYKSMSRWKNFFKDQICINIASTASSVWEWFN